jgi:hypothetical protein
MRSDQQRLFDPLSAIIRSFGFEILIQCEAINNDYSIQWVRLFDPMGAIIRSFGFEFLIQCNAINNDNSIL